MNRSIDRIYTFSIHMSIISTNIISSSSSSSSFGFIILVLANLLWVLSSEITRFIFIDEKMKKPFFVLCFRNWFLCIYFVRYAMLPKKIIYTKLDDDDIESLSIEGFEMMTDSDDVIDERKKVRFSRTKEIRRLPSKEAKEAEESRRSYSNSFNCNIPSLYDISPKLILIFILSPMWLISSITYQTSLIFNSVSSLNLLSATSSVFVLILSILIPSSHSHFTINKIIMVILNVIGISIISQSESSSTIGTSLALFSSFTYALYLIIFSKFIDIYGDLDMDYLFGCMGITSIILSILLLPLLHWTEIESILPLPPIHIWILLTISALIGTLIGDRLWLEGTKLTSTLTSSLSSSLSIPLSFIVDTFFRHRLPSSIQLIAAVPITLSFLGANIIDASSKKIKRIPSIESESLIDNQDL